MKNSTVWEIENSMLARETFRPNRAKCNCQSIPTVDGDDHHRQINELPFVKVLAGEAIYFIRNVARAYLGHRLGPGQSSAFRWREKGSLAPHTQGITAQRSWSSLQRSQMRTPKLA